MPTRSIPNSLFINTILLGGSSAQKIAAAGAAGFDAVELWSEDVEAYSDTRDELREVLRSHRVDLTDLQVLRDFDGAPDDVRDSKRDEAIRMLDRAVDIGADLVMIAASTDARSIADRIVEDLRWFCDEADARGLRVGYESLSWSTRSTTLVEAWARIREVDRQNLGVVIDAFHIFVHGRDASDLDGIPVEKIFAVQLSDLPHTVEPEVVIETARHHRLLPGEGTFDIPSLLSRLDQAGYTGPIGLEVFNDDMKASDPFVVANRAMDALQRILEPYARWSALGRSAA
jgi:4-hydroxyphenylpyruvate dioxygenase